MNGTHNLRELFPSAIARKYASRYLIRAESDSFTCACPTQTRFDLRDQVIRDDNGDELQGTHNIGHSQCIHPPR